MAFEPLGDWKRTRNCGELRRNAVGQTETLMGWVLRRRDHGGVIFIDLRDRFGITQVVFNPETNPAAHEKGHGLRSEDVVAVRGEVLARTPETVNAKMATGEIEVAASDLKILNKAQTPLFPLDETEEPNENLRLTYRYLDLRRPSVSSKLVLRHQISQSVRRYLDENQFLEIETPVLTKSTPEGARDFLVPSRLNPGKFYALPQSPQLFKQLLMVGGMDRYYQIARCFRDEDLRADRQPEFTQIDCEMSFITQEDILTVMEGLIARVFKEIKGIDVSLPLPRLEYMDAMERYGVDKPDIRFGLEMVDFTDVMKGSGFKVFADAVASGGVVKAINAKGCAHFSRKQIDDLTDFVRRYKAKGLAYIKVDKPQPDGLQSPILKFMDEATIKTIIERTGAQSGDLIFFGADSRPVVYAALGNLRNTLGDMLGLRKPDEYKLLWVINFPLLDYDAEEKRWVAMHHPFTMPLPEDVERLKDDPGSVRSAAYDIVLNGNEIGGGSIRIHDADIQQQMFSLLGIGPEEAMQKFGFLLKAFQFGAPPHGGIAFGLDRLTMILSGTDNIRDVIAFPKTQSGGCLLTDAPSDVTHQQLAELHLKKNLPAKAKE